MQEMTFFDKIQAFALLSNYVGGENWDNAVGFSNEKVDHILKHIGNLDTVELVEGYKIPFWCKEARSFQFSVWHLRNSLVKQARLANFYRFKWWR